MSTIEQLEQLSLDDLIRIYDQEGAFEFVDGERKPLMPPVALHGLTIRILFRLLDAFCQTRQFGEVFTEMPYVLMYGSGWVKGSRVPDLMFFAAERWQSYTSTTENWQHKPFLLVPDLAVEVVSANDLYTELQAKVERFRADGVKLVWVVDPHRARVDVYEGERSITLGQGDTLTGSTVMPELEVPLKELFPEPPSP